MDRDPEVVGLMDRLARPFPASKIKWKPQTVQGNRALAIAYIDARTVQERLDEVLGPENWQSKFAQLPNGAVACELSVRVGGEWIMKSDVGGESEQPDRGDRTKAAYSDALKRAAVQFGIGRFLYSLPKQWVGYDPQKRQFTQTPALPKGLGLPAEGGGCPPAGTNRGGNSAANSRGVNTAAAGPPAARKPAGETKAAQASNGTPDAGPKTDATPADEVQIKGIDAALKVLGKDDKWLAAALTDRFGKTQPAELTYPEAEQVLLGLNRKISDSTKPPVAAAPAANKSVESKGNAPATSAGKTPPRRGRF